MGYSDYSKGNANGAALDVDALYQTALTLLADHNAKHAEMRKNKEIVRQRTQPKQVAPDKTLITSRTAMGWAMMAQMRSFFNRATRQVEVMRDKKTREEDVRTSKNERWLIGSSALVNKQNAFVESQALYYGLELGEMILGLSFNPYLAKQGKFPIEVYAPDPECCAYSRSHYGLTYFVSNETRTVDALKDELETIGKRGSRVTLPECVMDAKRSPTDVVEDMRLYTKTHEIRWVDGDHVYTRRHFCGRVPFDIAYFQDVPSDRPEEWGRGIISPVRDLLESRQQLIDLFVTDAELGAHPTGILNHGNGRFEIVQLSLGEEYLADEGGDPAKASLIPINLNPNHQLLQELAVLLSEEVDIAGIPRSTMVGPKVQLSGYALEKYMAGIDARVEDMKVYAELALGSHLALRLKLVRQMATREMARKLSPDDPDLYMSAFAVPDAEEVKGKGRRKKIHVWAQLSADDVSDEPVVNVSINPNIPARMSQRIQQMQGALAAGLEYEYVVREIFEAEDADELLTQHEITMLVANNPKFAEFYWGYLEKRVLDRDKDMRKEKEAYDMAQQLLEQGKNTIDGEVVKGDAPPPMLLPDGSGAPPPPGAMVVPPQGGGEFGDANMPMDPNMVAELIAMLEQGMIPPQGAPPMAM